MPTVDDQQITRTPLDDSPVDELMKHGLRASISNPRSGHVGHTKFLWQIPLETLIYRQQLLPKCFNFRTICCVGSSVDGSVYLALRLWRLTEISAPVSTGNEWPVDVSRTCKQLGCLELSMATLNNIGISFPTLSATQHTCTVIYISEHVFRTAHGKKRTCQAVVNYALTKSENLGQRYISATPNGDNSL